MVTRPPRDWIQISVTALPGLAAVIALIFTSLAIHATDNQLQLTQQAQITDRYNAAITNLGSPSVDVRLGGIYALQRIMQDSPRDQPTVVAVLCAFVRDHASTTTVKPPATPQTSPAPSQPSTDIEGAVTVVGTRNSAYDGSTTVIDFTDTDLGYADLADANLVGANLIGANLSHANLSRTNLSRANLAGADLSGANLIAADLLSATIFGANLSGTNFVNANLINADLNGTDLFSADLSGAFLSGANLDGAYLARANMTGAYLVGANLTGADLTGAKLTGAKLTGTKGLRTGFPAEPAPVLALFNACRVVSSAPGSMTTVNASDAGPGHPGPGRGQRGFSPPGQHARR
jgi:hypothetical protein